MLNYLLASFLFRMIPIACNRLVYSKKTSSLCDLKTLSTNSIIKTHLFFKMYLMPYQFFIMWTLFSFFILLLLLCATP